jgi:hypothetical protein
MLEEPELQVCEQQERWQWREDLLDAPSESGSGDSPLARWFAATIEIALWFALGLFIAMVGWWLWRRRPSGLSVTKRRTRLSGDSPIAGRNENLVPPDAHLGDVAWQLWNAGQPREALRLLYQGSLAGLATQHGLSVRASATEDECLRLAAIQLAHPELLNFLRRLTHAWQATAYGHQPLDEAVARNLCEEWSRYFASAGALPA